MIWTGSPALLALAWLVGAWVPQFSSLTMIWTGCCCHRTVGYPSGSDHQFTFTLLGVGSYFGGSVKVVAIPIYGEGVSKLGIRLCATRRYTITQSVRLSPLVHLLNLLTTGTWPLPILSGGLPRAPCSIVVRYLWC